MLEKAQLIIDKLKRKKVVAVMPAFNEAGRVEKVIEAMPEFIWKVVVVDDGSTDGTNRLCQERGAVVVRHEKNLGSGSGYKDGFRKALELGADIIVLLHSDGQHDPAEIIDVVAPIIEDHAEFTLGCRLKGRGETMPLPRLIGNRALTWLWSVAVGRRLEDALTGFHAVTADALRKLHIDRWANDYLVETDMLEDVLLSDIPIAQVPTQCIYKGEVSLVEPFKDGRAYALMALGALYRRSKKKLGFPVMVPDHSYRVWKSRKPSKF